MGAISSPLQAAGLLKNNCSSDPDIYAIYSFVDTDENDRTYFGIFYSPENDLNQPWFKDVTLLWEKGQLTKAGEEFIARGWHLASVVDDNGVLEMLYRSNDGEEMHRRGGKPIGEDGKEIPRSEWPTD